MTYLEWIGDDERNEVQCISKTCTDNDPRNIITEDYPQFQCQVNYKRIQQNAFQNVKNKKDSSIIQIVFSVTYSRDYQNEIQTSINTRR